MGLIDRSSPGDSKNYATFPERETLRVRDLNGMAETQRFMAMKKFSDLLPDGKLFGESKLVLWVKF